jgi:hypothetical protein
MDQSRFDALARQLAAPSRRALLGWLGTIAAGSFLAVGTHEVAAKKKKKSCKRGKVACGRQCCPRGQGCVGGRCGCPPAKCAQAVDPTSDQLEGCFCDVTVGGRETCMASIPCGLVTDCSSNAECPPGWVCLANACEEGVGGCAALCSLG